MRSTESLSASYKGPLLVIAGPTGVGKSALAVEIAKRLGGSILSGDSMQVYRGMDIGTAKIRPEEMQGIPHYLLDILEPTDDWNVARFLEAATDAYGEIRAQGRFPILCGGTGFYIDAFLRDIDFAAEEEGTALRAQLEEELSARGADELYQRLLALDPAYARSLHPHNEKRLLRALAYCLETGKLFSEYNAAQKQRPAAYDTLYCVLTDDRATLYERIDARVEAMMQAGLLEEVQRLLEAYPALADPSSGFVSMQAIGYKELRAHLRGECSLEEAVRTIQTESRHFAKRQWTWFKNSPGAVFYKAEDYGGKEGLTDHLVRECQRRFFAGEDGKTPTE